MKLAHVPETRPPKATETPAGVARVARYVRLAVLLALLLSGTSMTFGIGVATGLGLGGLLGAANLLALRSLIERAIASGTSAGPAARVLSLKLAGLAAGVYALIRWAGVSPVPLALGFALVPIVVGLVGKPLVSSGASASSSDGAEPSPLERTRPSNEQDRA